MIPASPDPAWRRRNGLILLALYLGLVFGGFLAGKGLVGVIDLDIRPSNEARVHDMIMSATAVYILASAVPFVPGAEIGFALIRERQGSAAVGAPGCPLPGGLIE